jgi:hypothetical protein
MKLGIGEMFSPGLCAGRRASTMDHPPLVKPIHISGSLSLEDYFYGMRLYRRRIQRFGLLFGIISILLVDVLFFYSEISEGNLSGVIFTFILSLVGFFVVVIILRGLVNWRIKKACKIGKGPFAQTESIISEEGYESQQEVMVAKVLWSAFSKYRYSDRLVVLFQDGSPNSIAILPRNKFQTPEDWECFIDLLDRKMPRC